MFCTLLPTRYSKRRIHWIPPYSWCRATALLLVMALAYANGPNDVSKAIATLVGSGVTNYRTAIIWGTAWTVAGAGLSALMADAMLKTFSVGLIQPGIATPPALALAILIGSMGWVLIASRTGLPVSTTHALTGALVGAGWIALGGQGLIWSALFGKIALPLLLSPILALTLSVLVHPADSLPRKPLGRHLPLPDVRLSRSSHSRHPRCNSNPFSGDWIWTASYGCACTLRPSGPPWPHDRVG